MLVNFNKVYNIYLAILILNFVVDQTLFKPTKPKS